jgi:hypothetical protein
MFTESADELGWVFGRFLNWFAQRSTSLTFGCVYVHHHILLGRGGWEVLDDTLQRVFGPSDHPALDARSEYGWDSAHVDVR